MLPLTLSLFPRLAHAGTDEEGGGWTTEAEIAVGVRTGLYAMFYKSETQDCIQSFALTSNLLLKSVLRSFINKAPAPPKVKCLHPQKYFKVLQHYFVI